MKNRKPEYLKLYEKLREGIVSGFYADKLPSKRALADQTGLSVLTVEHAYALLCDEGYAEARQRSGYFCLYRPEDGFLQAKHASYRQYGKG